MAKIANLRGHSDVLSRLKSGKRTAHTKKIIFNARRRDLNAVRCGLTSKSIAIELVDLVNYIIHIKLRLCLSTYHRAPVVPKLTLSCCRTSAHNQLEGFKLETTATCPGVKRHPILPRHYQRFSPSDD